MGNKNSKNLSVFQQIYKSIKKILKLFKKNSKKNYKIFQSIQLTFIYFFATIVLLYTIQNALGYIPNMILAFFPFFENILDFPVLKLLAAPEKTFILYLVILEVLINRPLFNFSLLIKFNVLFIFVLEMLQNLIISYWDLLFTREIGMISGNSFFDRHATIEFYSLLFLYFFGIYFYSYLRGLQGLFPSFKYFSLLQSIVDSVAFWLQIKTPTNNSKDN
jgi:hypothetical protein